MTKPHEEKWRYEPNAIMRDEGDGCSHYVYSPYLEESLDSDTLRLMSAAPDMARVLLDVEWQGWDEDDGSRCPSCRAPQHVKPLRYDADGKYLGYTENTHATDCALDAALRKAGVR